MAATRRLKELLAAVGTLDLPQGSPVLGLSGGADSATLGYLLARQEVPFRAVHVNHGLAASRHLEEAARLISETLEVKLDVVEVTVPPGSSPEGQARTVRYDALLAALAPEEILLTAHTLDDQAETVLLNLLRGAGPTGLAGIGPREDLVVRPLVGVTRAVTREIAALADLPYFDDPANLDPAFRRNQIRREVLPRLSSRFNPRLSEALARAASLIAADDMVLEDQARAVPVIEQESAVAVPIGALHAVPRPVADRALRRCLARARPPYAPSAAEMAEIWAVADRSRRSVTLSGGVEVSHRGPLLVVTPWTDAAPKIEPTALDVGATRIGRYEIVVERAEIVCRVAPIGLWSAIFPPTVQLSARLDDKGRLIVEVDGEPAWIVGEKRLPVAFYRPGSTGYLSVLVTEGSGWTSSP